MKKLISKYIKNPMLQRMLVYTFSDGLSRAMPFLVLPIIANYLTVEDFGLVSNFTVLVELFAAFVSFSAAMSLAVDYYKVDKATLVVMITGLFVFTFLIIVIFHQNIFVLLRLSLQWQVYALLTAYFNSINQLYNTKLRYDEKAKLFGLLQFLRAAVSAGLSLFLVIVLDWSWEGRAFSLLATGLLLFIISFVLLKKEKVIFSNINVRSVYAFLLFGLPLLPQTLSQWLRGGFEKVLVTKQVGLGGNGLLSFSGTIASIFLLFSTAFFSAYTPHLFKSLSQIEKEPSHTASILADVLQKAYFFLGFLFIAIVIGNFATVYLINHFFKAGYQGAEKFMPLALLNVFFSALSSWLASFLMFKKKTKMLGIITVCQTGVQVLLTYWLVMRFATIGALYAGITGSFLFCAALFLFVNKEYKLPWLSLKTSKG
jgi:O-antigen/teichoic acid export membrane protein